MKTDRKTLQLEVVAENADRSGVYFTVLDLPAMDGRIKDALQRLRAADHPDRPFDVSIRESPKLPELADITLLAPTLPELNFFARRLAFMPDEDILLLKGVFLQRMAVGRYERGIPMKELINLTYGLDMVMIASNVGSDEALGRFVIEHDLNEDVSAIPESSRYLLDQAQIGKLQRKHEGGVFVDGCYVVAGEYELAEIYDGTHLPEIREEPEDAVFRLLVAQTPVDEPEETMGNAEWISLPISPEKAAQIAHAQNEVCMEDCVYYDMDSAIPQIDDQVYGSMDHFVRLNQIAIQYQTMTEPEQIKYKAVLEAEPCLTMEKALELASHLPEYEFTPSPCDEADFFKEYTEALPQRVPLSQNKEFKPIKNAVIQEALGLHADRQDVEEPAQADAPDPEMPEAPESDSQADDPIEPDPPPGFRSYSGGWGRKKDTWWTDEYKEARAFLYGTKTSKPDFEQALAGLKEEALRGNGFAMHDLGKMALSGLGCEKDEEQAQEWFRKAFSAFCAREPKEEKPGYLRYRIGKMYAFGYGVDQDYLKAAEWYEKSVAEGNPFAAYALGSLYHRGQGVNQDEEKAFALFTMAATDENNPNAYAQYELGRMCRNGIGTTPDQAASEQWYKQAYRGFLEIEQNMADDKLYYRLGQMNLTGTGTGKDPEQARMYFEKAAELGNADAMYGSGKLYLSRDFSGRDVKTAIDYLMAAAGKGHDYAMYTLGKLFLEGKEIPKNPEYALRWLEEAVDKENPYAEYLLGKTLLQGVDLPQDIPRAFSLLERAAARSNPYAAYALGKALLERTVLLQNLPRAMKLLAFSADQEFSAAQYLLGKVFSNGELLPKDIPKAILYLTKAAEQDHEYAQYLLGKLYLADEGIPKDAKAAMHWFTRAADQGNAFAQYQLGKLFLYGHEVEQDMEKAISYLTASADQGNVYAAQLLQSVHSNRNWSAALGSLRLLQHLARIIQNRIEDERKGGKGGIDRKLKRKIDEKKQAHGLKQG